MDKLEAVRIARTVMLCRDCASWRRDGRTRWGWCENKNYTFGTRGYSEDMTYTKDGCLDWQPKEAK